MTSKSLANDICHRMTYMCHAHDWRHALRAVRGTENDTYDSAYSLLNGTKRRWPLQRLRCVTSQLHSSR